MNVRLTKKQLVHIANSDDLYTIMLDILKRESRLHQIVEHFWLVGMNNANIILFIELISLGNGNRVIVKPAEVYRFSVQKLASKVVIIHNHPSGVLKPSNADIDLTDKLLKNAMLLEIDLLDHLIISDKGYFSFEDHGLMEQIRNSGNYEVTKGDRAMLEKIRIKREKKITAKETRIEMAKDLLALNQLSHEAIRKVSKLTTKEFDNLLKNK